MNEIILEYGSVHNSICYIVLGPRLNSNMLNAGLFKASFV